MTSLLSRITEFYKKDECSKYYKFGKTLGTGSFATVKCAIHKGDNSRWAIKCIDKSSLAPEDEEALKIEVEVLQMVEHTNIVRLKEIFDCSKAFYMVMEEMGGGELFDRIVEKEKYSEKEARVVIQKLANALKYCHSIGVVHRDLKPENLLYTTPHEDAEIKIADFGLAKLLKGDAMMQTACGTPGYVAPEILEGKVYCDSVDIWSLGVITYILLCGFPPFYDENNASLFASIKAGRYDFPSPYWDQVSEEVKDLISKMLVVNPKNRYTATDVLAHPWIKNEEASLSAPLTHFNRELKRYNARRRFKAGIMAAKAIRGLAMTVEDPKRRISLGVPPVSGSDSSNTPILNTKKNSDPGILPKQKADDHQVLENPNEILPKQKADDDQQVLENPNEIFPKQKADDHHLENPVEILPIQKRDDHHLENTTTEILPKQKRDDHHLENTTTEILPKQKRDDHHQIIESSAEVIPKQKDDEIIESSVVTTNGQ